MLILSITGVVDVLWAWVAGCMHLRFSLAYCGRNGTASLQC
jgi:hypothetical protein